MYNSILNSQRINMYMLQQQNALRQNLNFKNVKN